MKGLLDQESGGSRPRGEGSDWLDERSASPSREALEIGLGALDGPHQDVFVPLEATADRFATWVGGDDRARSTGDVAQRGEWPDPPLEVEPGSADFTRVPLGHPLIVVATELREAIGEALGDLGVSPMADDEGQAHLEDPVAESFTAEAPLVQFARGAALVERAMKRCRELKLRQRDGVQQLRLAGYEALVAYRSLRASSDLMNDVRIAAYSLGKLG